MFNIFTLLINNIKLTLQVEKGNMSQKSSLACRKASNNSNDVINIEI